MEYIVNKFKVALLQENERHNLVSRKDTEQEIEKHIEDSRQVMKWFDFAGLKGVDIGSGAGFPGLIIAMLIPEVQMTLIESDLKKSEFLERMQAELKLNNAQILKVRAEEIGHNPKYRERFDFCTSRAVNTVNVLLEYGIPLIKTGGKLLLWKGRNYESELNKAANALEILNASVIKVYHYTLINDLDRVIVAIEKLAKTSERYPRRTGIPVKRPL